MIKKESSKSLVRSVAHFVLVALFAVLFEKTLSGEFKTEPFLVATILIVIAQIVVVFLIFHIGNRIDDVAQHIGIRTTLVNAPVAYEKAREVALGASEEILVVNNWELPDAPNPEANPYREHYFSAVLKEAIARPIKYERIVQLPRSGGDTTRRNQELVSHMLECVEFVQRRKDAHGKIGVFRCEPSLMVSFLLVDRRTIFLQLDKFDEESKCYQFSKCLIIEDDTKKMSSAFTEMFDDLRRTSHPMTVDDLTKLLSPKGQSASST